MCSHPNQLIEKTTEYNKFLCLPSVDYENTVPSVEQETILTSLFQKIFDKHITRRLRNIYATTPATVRLNDKETKSPSRNKLVMGMESRQQRPAYLKVFSESSAGNYSNERVW